MAVVKANGYGHGAASLLPALAGAPMLAVAAIEEALALRAAGARMPILLLEGVFEAAELRDCAEHGLGIVLHEPGQLRMLEARQPAPPLDVWVKLDTGMNRLGFKPEAVPDLCRRLEALHGMDRVRCPE